MYQRVNRISRVGHLLWVAGTHLLEFQITLFNTMIYPLGRARLRCPPSRLNDTKIELRPPRTEFFHSFGGSTVKPTA